MNPTTVISVRGRNGANRQALLDDPDFVYVGREFAGWQRSIFGNPFKGAGAVSNFRDELVRARRYANCLMPLNGIQFSAWEWRALQLSTLRGKKLGCWCGSWAPGQPIIPCHACVLAVQAEIPDA